MDNKIEMFKVSHDGGKDSGVTGYWLIEWKSVFSIVLLKFNKGSRDAFHSHAFNAYTWWLKGKVVELFYDEEGEPKDFKFWTPSFIPKYTPKGCFHKIIASETSWALSFRGPWDATWKEHKDGETYTLTHGRNKV